MLCHNTYGYAYWARNIMYQGAIGTIVSYCASIFFTKIRKVNKKLQKLQRQMAIKCASLYKTTGGMAASVIAGLMPLELTIEKRAIKWLSTNKRSPLIDNEYAKAISILPQQVIDKSFEDWSQKRWQIAWDNTNSGKWTHLIIPNISERLKMDIKLNFWLCQGLSGHGTFPAYLERIKKTTSKNLLLWTQQGRHTSHYDTLPTI
jgi:hypothetical protein